MRRIFPVLAVLCFLACGAMGWLLWRQDAAIKRAAAAQKASSDQLDRQTDELHREVNAAKEARAAADKKAADLAKSQSQSVGFISIRTGGGPDPKNMRVVHMSDIIKDHPELAAIQAKQMRRNMMMQYGQAFAGLNVPSDKLSKLEDLMAERQASQSDFYQSAQAAGLQFGSQAVQDALKQTTGDIDQQIGDLMGTDGKAYVQQLQQKANAGNMIRFQYGPDFTDAGIPLSSDQSAGLAQAMADAQTEMSKQPPPNTAPDPSTYLNSYNQLVLSKAAQVLTPDQVQVLKNDQIADNQRWAIYQQYMKGGGNFSIEP